MLYYISDLHLSHFNILRYTNRNFTNVHEMNCSITEQWNDTVKKDDIVICLGDLTMKNPEEFIKRLNGKIILIKGNHDRKKYFNYYLEVHNKMEMNIGKYNCLLQHRPVLPSIPYIKHGTFRYSFNDTSTNVDKYDFIICGHSHNKFKVKGKNINLSVENILYRPISYFELLDYLNWINGCGITEL